MHALAGIWYRDGRPIPNTTLEVLTDHGQSVGPDGGGSVTSRQGLALLAHKRAFDRLSAAERQPYVFGRGSVVTWDGRLDNREDLLVSLHHDLGPDVSDAALVAAGYARWGQAVLARLIGDWALAIWDAESETMVLARDIMGNRPLYYRENKSDFAWASSTVALADCFACEPDPDYIAGCLTFGVPLGMTPFRSIRKLVAGHVLTVRRTGSQTRRHGIFEPKTIRYRDVDTYSDHLRTLLLESVKVRMRANRPVWPHLSGGWDSSAVVCLAEPLVRRGLVEAPRVQPISTIHSASPASDESEYIGFVEEWTRLRAVRRDIPLIFTLNELIGHRCHYSISEHYRRRFLEPTRAAGDHVVMTGDPANNVMYGSGLARTALLEPLFDGHPMQSFRLCSARAKHMQRPLPVVLAQLVRFTTPVSTPARRGTAHRVGTQAFHKQAADLGVPPSLLTRFHDVHFPEEDTPVGDLPVLKRELASALYGGAAHDRFLSDTLTQEVWETHPYTHRPLLEFMLATPILPFWSPTKVRAGMGRALADILPPQILSRTTKGNPRSAKAHDLLTLGPSVAQLGDMEHEAQNWELVKQGYLEQRAVSALLQALRTDVLQGSPYKGPWFTLEAWLQTLARASRTAREPLPTKKRAPELVARGTTT